jgi:hypothetical protein
MPLEKGSLYSLYIDGDKRKARIFFPGIIFVSGILMDFLEQCIIDRDDSSM